MDLSVFEARYRNDETGAPAYDPGILLKIILYAYARGIISSREIERCCRENTIFMALSADTQPHFSTIAGFISSMSEEIPVVFPDVLLVCDEMGMIGEELFAIDGCKIPSNASKEWSGTRAEFEKKKQKMEAAIRYLLKRHRERDKSEEAVSVVEREETDGYVADTLFRKRDPRFAQANRYKERHREARRKSGGVLFTNHDFHYDPERQLCICPAGK